MPRGSRPTWKPRLPNKPAGRMNRKGRAEALLFCCAFEARPKPVGPAQSGNTGLPGGAEIQTLVSFEEHQGTSLFPPPCGEGVRAADGWGWSDWVSECR